MLLKIFNAILTALLEVKEFEFFDDFKEINQKGLNLIITIMNQKNLQKDRIFNNIKNIFIFNYFVFLSNDKFNISNSLFKETVDNILIDIFDICDQCNIDSYSVLFQFLERLYIPYILGKIDESTEHIEVLYKFMKVCRNNLVENCKWTFRYKEVHTLMNFILNKQFFFNENVIKSKILNKTIMESWEIGSKYWLVQRGIIDHLFKIFYKYPEIMHNFYDVIIYLLKSREHRGFDANLLFYIDECYIPVYILIFYNFFENFIKIYRK